MLCPYNFVILMELIYMKSHGEGEINCNIHSESNMICHHSVIPLDSGINLAEQR